MKQSQLTATIERIKALELEQEAIADELEALKDCLKAELVAQGTDCLIIGNHKIRYTNFTAKRFDTKAFKADNEELYLQYLKETAGKRFYIS